MTTPPPPPDAWPRVRALFEAALEQPPAEREAWLALQPHDAELLHQVRKLLLQVTDAGATPWPDGAVWAGDSATPQRLGAWEIVGRLGSGGMGEVFEARRADGRYEGRAAVKLLRPGLDGEAVAARFAQEQQTLARLRHPHIAQLLDAGLSDERRPYMVMELVRGRPLDEAAAALPLPERLALFLQLCEAVAHAHKNLLVHRDLKPGNVLVDDEGQVKLLDFGIAKALDAMAAEVDVSTTLAGQRPFTPAYASPEQVRSEPVSTATDVYSLGVLLYTLVTGQRPYGRDATTPAEAARAVLEEPPRPAGEFVKLPADLQNVLAKALRKDLDERYASVDALAADLRAWLGGFPVSARPAGWAYVAGKFVRRHRTGSALAALALVAVLSLSAVASFFAADARRSRDAARASLGEARRLAGVMVFDVNNALKQGALEGRKALVKAAGAFYEAQLKDGDTSPASLLANAEAIEHLADLEGNPGFANLGDMPAAQAHYAQALALYQRVPAGSAEQLDALRGQVWVHRAFAQHHLASSDAPGALRELQLGFGAVEHGIALAPGHPKLLLARCQLLMRLTDVYYNQEGQAHLGRIDEALKFGAQQVECARADVARRGNAASRQLLSGGLVRMSALQLHAGRLDEAIASARENVQVLESALRDPAAPDGWDSFLLAGYGQLGYALLHRSNDDEGSSALARSVEIARRSWQADRADRRARESFASLSFTLGDALLGGRRHPEAEAACREAVAAERELVLAEARPSEVHVYLWARRCELESRLPKADARLLSAVDAAIAEARGLLVRLKQAGPERLPWLQLRLLRTQLLQRQGQEALAMREARDAFGELDRWEADHPGNDEYTGNSASLYQVMAALDWHQLGRDDRQRRCDWAGAAATRFARLKAAHGLDATLSEMAGQSAAVSARACGRS